MTEESLKFLLTLRMKLDPWPFSFEELCDFDYLLLCWSRDKGYTDWVDAYHKIK